LRGQYFQGAATVPVGMLRSASPEEVLNYYVVFAGLDRTPTAPAPVELLGYRSDEPDLVPAIVYTDQAFLPVG
jgi:hypothetical protein